MTTPLPPDLEETRVVGEPPAGGGPPGRGPEPEPSRGFGWGMLVGALLLAAVAGVAAAVWIVSRGGNAESATVSVPTTATTAATTALLPPNRVFVPDVTGLKQEQAASRLGSAGLEPKVRLKATPKPTGVVLAQTPKAGKQAKKGSTVRLVVDGGAARVSVPDVGGLPVADAGARLKDAGLRAQTTNVTTADADPGTVVAQAPKPGAKAKQGALVTLSVARAPAGATTQTATTETTTTAAMTTTQAQQPPQPATATVPDLSGQVLADAADALAAAGVYPNVAYVPSDEPLGSVVAQGKPAGAEVDRGSYVRVNVARGPEQRPDDTVPDVRGRPRVEAMRTLGAAGFEAKVVERPVPASKPADTVVDEQPSRGTRIPRGALVILIVGTR